MPLEAMEKWLSRKPSTKIWVLIPLLASMYCITVLFPHLSFSTCAMERIVPVWLTLPGHRMNAVTDRKVFQMENVIK